MKIKFDVTPKEFIIVKDILEKYLPNDSKAWVFGSRAKSSSLVGSDLDLAIECQDKLELKLLAQIKIAFEDSRLPYHVDVIDIKSVKSYFKELIKDEMVVFPLRQFDKVPALRFSEFSGRWILSKIGSILTIGSGKDYKHLDQGNIPVYGTGGYMTSVSEYLYDGESVCIGRKGTIDKPTYLNEKFWTVDTLFFTHSFKESLPKFIFAIFQKINWKKYNEAGGVPSLSKKTIEDIDICLPKIEEQQKIAAFLTQVDNKIEQLTWKKQLLADYKKGVMQQIFSQKIRFKRDNGSDYPDWEVKALGGIAKIYDGTHMTPKYKKEGIPFYSVEHLTKNNFVETKFISQEVFEKENKRIKLEAGDILMTRIGDIGTSKYINWNVNASFYVSLALIKKSNQNNTLYIDQYIKSDFFQKELHKRTIHVAFPKKINLGEIGRCLISEPSHPEEQQKIANFLTEIDTRISQVEKQLSGTQQFKSGLLQKIFV